MDESHNPFGVWMAFFVEHKHLGFAEATGALFFLEGPSHFGKWSLLMQDVHKWKLHPELLVMCAKQWSSL